MFCLRVHTLDDVSLEEGESSQQQKPQNPKIQELKGAIHLFRNVSSALEILPPDSNLLFVLAVPTRFSSNDFIRFCGAYAERISLIWFIRNDGIDDRYSALVTFADQKSSSGFYRNFNGLRFSSSEAEVCHILITSGVEYTEVAGPPPAGFTELPTCPVCLERLDQDTSGIVTTLCDHSFQCPCISKWEDSSCLVCRFCKEQPEKPTCSVCETSENLWICLICGFVGCGRYKERHAVRHWEITQHCYSLDLQTQRVWDYVGDTYVHRLNQSKSDGKLVKLNNCGSTDEECGTCECSEDSGISGALLSSKVDAIVEEYNHLLANQLENQRQYYESLLLEAKGKREKTISDAVDKAVTSKLQDIQLKLETCMEEKRNVAKANEDLLKNQELWRRKVKEIEGRVSSTLNLRDEKILDLEEQIRDLTIYLEAQKTLDKMNNAEDIKGGTVLPVQLQQPSSASRKKPSKTNRRRN